MLLSIDVNNSWVPVKKYIEKDTQVNRTEEEPIYVDHYASDALHDILDTQHNIFNL